MTTVTWLVRRPVGTGGVGGAFWTTVESRTGSAGWSPASPVVSSPVVASVLPSTVTATVESTGTPATPSVSTGTVAPSAVWT